MLTHTEIAPTDVEKRPFEFKEPFTAYKENGGILPEEDYRRLVDAVEKETALHLKRPTNMQAQNMGKTFEIDMLGTTAVFYSLLREWENFDKWGLSKDIRRTIQRMSDQEIFAEVLGIENRLEDRQQFIDLHPNIFEEGRPASWGNQSRPPQKGLRE